MRLLSLDCSTTTASLALIDDSGLVAERVWFEERARHEGLFEFGVAAMAEAGWRWEELTLFTVGRGPGAYSGLRVSLLAAQAWAAPGRIPVVAVSSMEAAAMALMDREGLDALLVVGDARRQSVWYGEVRRACLDTDPTSWQVIGREEFVTKMSPGLSIASPHREVLTDLRAANLSIRWHDDPLIPRAVDVARLAQRRLTSPIPPEALTPLYMHAAV